MIFDWSAGLLEFLNKPVKDIGCLNIYVPFILETVFPTHIYITKKLHENAIKYYGFHGFIYELSHNR